MIQNRVFFCKFVCFYASVTFRPFYIKNLKRLIYKEKELKGNSCISVRIVPNPGELFYGLLLKAVQRGQTGAVGSFDTSNFTQIICGVRAMTESILLDKISNL